jgi:hypothetical protein
MVQGLDKKIKFMRGRNVSCTMVGGQGTKLHFVKTKLYFETDLDVTLQVNGGGIGNALLFR